MAPLFNHRYQPSDVEFAVGSGGERIQAHRQVLADSSAVFGVMFNGRFAESEQNRVIAVEDIEPEIFRQVLEYVYSGCDYCEITEDNVMDLLYVATKYMLAGLEKLCNGFLQKHGEFFSLLETFVFDGRMMYPEMYRYCFRLMLRNPLRLFKTAIADIPLEIARKIFSSTEIRCTDAQLLKAIDRWIELQPNHQHRDEMAQIRSVVQRRHDDPDSRRNLYKRTPRPVPLEPLSYSNDPLVGFVMCVRRPVSIIGVGIFSTSSVQDKFDCFVNISLRVENRSIITRPFRISINDSKTDVVECLFPPAYLFNAMIVNIKFTAPRQPSSHCWPGTVCEDIRRLSNQDLELHSLDESNNMLPVAYIIYDQEWDREDTQDWD